MLEELTYETYAEQDLDGVPRFHNWYMALPGKSPYDKHYIEECKKRADAFFKEKVLPPFPNPCFAAPALTNH